MWTIWPCCTKAGHLGCESSAEREYCNLSSKFNFLHLIFNFLFLQETLVIYRFLQSSQKTFCLNVSPHVEKEEEYYLF